MRSAVCSAKKAWRRRTRLFCCRALRSSKFENLVSKREGGKSPTWSRCNSNSRGKGIPLHGFLQKRSLQLVQVAATRSPCM
jgi:hypothetical protein